MRQTWYASHTNVNEDNTDHFWQITYIGVPLTVAGVLPLLWNMIMAIRIWLKLKNSIPLRYKKYYSLLPDPAAGTVTVVARAPSLELPGLWSTEAPRIAPAVSHFTASRPVTKDNGAISSFKRFNVPRQKLLRRTWMTLTEQCALILASPQIDENVCGTKLEHKDEDEVRFSVESDMNANAPTPLKMTWAQFVWLSLALGVSPYDSAWRERLRTWWRKAMSKWQTVSLGKRWKLKLPKYIMDT